METPTDAPAPGPAGPRPQDLSDTGLAAWACASLLGVLASVAMATASKVLASNPIPGMVVSAGSVVLTVVMMFLATGRYLRTRNAPAGRAGHILAVLAVVIVVSMGWLAVSFIFFADVATLATKSACAGS